MFTTPPTRRRSTTAGARRRSRVREAGAGGVTQRSAPTPTSAARRSLQPSSQSGVGASGSREIARALRDVADQSAIANLIAFANLTDDAGEKQQLITEIRHRIDLYAPERSHH